MEKLDYTEAEKEVLIDSMLAVIKWKLMKCYAEDIAIEGKCGVAGFYMQNGDPIAQKENGDYTYTIKYKLRDGSNRKDT